MHEGARVWPQSTFMNYIGNFFFFFVVPCLISVDICGRLSAFITEVQAGLTSACADHKHLSQMEVLPHSTARVYHYEMWAKWFLQSSAYSGCFRLHSPAHAQTADSRTHTSTSVWLEEVRFNPAVWRDLVVIIVKIYWIRLDSLLVGDCWGYCFVGVSFHFGRVFSCGISKGPFQSRFYQTWS